MQRLQATYDGLTSNVPEARHAVEQALAAWGLGDLAWTAALLVTELAANALLHARTGFTVTVLALPGGGARIEVADGSLRRPRSRSYGEDATTGRGLHLVEDLGRAWGVDPRPDGKSVWVELDAVPEDTADRPSEGDDDADLDALLLAFPDLDEGSTVPRDPALRAA